jgi:hypothetical protein
LTLICIPSSQLHASRQRSRQLDRSRPILTLRPMRHRAALPCSGEHQHPPPPDQRESPADTHKRGSQDSNLESPVLETGALASWATAPEEPDRIRVLVAIRGEGQGNRHPPQPRVRPVTARRSLAPGHSNYRAGLTGDAAQHFPSGMFRARRRFSPTRKTPDLNLQWLRMSDRSERIAACLSSANRVALTVALRGSKARECGRPIWRRAMTNTGEG